jgi:hypothetical protein
VLAGARADLLLRRREAVLAFLGADPAFGSSPQPAIRLCLLEERPRRTFLEMDELAALLDAAAEQEAPYRREDRGEVGPRTAEVAGLLEHGLRPPQIARRLGVARGSVSFHLRASGWGRDGARMSADG